MATRTTIFATNDNVTANDLNSLAGAWNSYTPTVAQGASTDITKTVTYAKYLQFGKLVIGQVALLMTGTGSAESSITVTLPVTAANAASGYLVIGSGMYADAGASTYGGTVYASTTTAAVLLADGETSGYVGSTPNIAVANNDRISLTFMYEAA